MKKKFNEDKAIKKKELFKNLEELRDLAIMKYSQTAHMDPRFTYYDEYLTKIKEIIDQKQIEIIFVNDHLNLK